MCCLCADDDDPFDAYARTFCCECGDGSPWWEDICSIWFAISVVCLGTFLGIGLAIYSIQTNEVQSKIIDPLSAGALTNTLAHLHTSEEIGAYIDPQFYGIRVHGISAQSDSSYNRPGFTGEHISSSMIYLHPNVPNINGFCARNTNSAFTTLVASFQFDADFKSVKNGPTATAASDPGYDYIEIRFEIPYGDVLDSETGDGYYGYKTTDSYTKRVDGHHEAKTSDPLLDLGAQETGDTENPHPSLVRKRCPIPYCLTWQDLGWLGGAWGVDNEETGFIDIVRATVPYSAASLSATTAEFHTISSVSKRLAVKSASGLPGEIVYVDTAIPELANMIKCGCSGESPMRFSCVLPSNSLMLVASTYRIDLELVYKVRPIARKPEKDTELHKPSTQITQ